MTEVDQELARKLLGADRSIRSGVVVYLNSGGPPMTVKRVNRVNVSCEWFDKTDQVRSHDFAKSMLSTMPIKRDGRPVGLVVIGDLAAEHLDKN